MAEQIAGLIHDLSHSAFSHTIDYLKKDPAFQKTHSAQDNFHDAYIRSSSVASILPKHGFQLDYILNETNFPLLENQLPDICADRLDYSLRQLVVTNLIDEADKNQIIESLTTSSGSFAFKDRQSATLFANLFWDMDIQKWSALPTAIMFSTTAALLNEAFKLGLLRLDELYQLGDLQIIAKIESHLSKSAALQNAYNLLHTEPEKFESNANKNPVATFCKARRVNPLFYDTDSSLKHLSDIDADFAQKFKSAPQFNEYHPCLK